MLRIRQISLDPREVARVVQPVGALVAPASAAGREALELIAQRLHLRAEHGLLVSPRASRTLSHENSQLQLQIIFAGIQQISLENANLKYSYIPYIYILQKSTVMGSSSCLIIKKLSKH